MRLFAFALIGFVLGELAGWIVNDSVRSRLAVEIAAAKPKESAVKPNAAAAIVKPNTTTASSATTNSAAAKPKVPATAGTNNKS